MASIAEYWRDLALTKRIQASRMKDPLAKAAMVRLSNHYAELAKEAALSRSTFFERFRRAVGISPMEYLLTWRMALAKDLLRRNEGRVAEIAQRVGYSSASTFSVAFTRHVGRPPAQYAREEQAAADAA